MQLSVFYARDVILQSLNARLTMQDQITKISYEGRVNEHTSKMMLDLTLTTAGESIPFSFFNKGSLSRRIHMRLSPGA